MDKLFVLENEAKKSLYQWDLNQRFIVNDPLIIQAHYYVSAKEAPLSCEVFEENGLFLVNIPNILLQKPGKHRVYAYHQDSTIDAMQFEVLPRPKPADYIYEETELVAIEELVEELIQKNQKSFEQELGEKIPDLSVLDELLFQKFGGEYNGKVYENNDFYFSKINWNLLLKFNRAYIQTYDNISDFGIELPGNKDGSRVYSLKAISRYGGAQYTDENGVVYDTMLPRHPWMKKIAWVKKYREKNPDSTLTDAQIMSRTEPSWEDYEALGPLVERRPDGHIRIPKGFSTAEGDASQLATSKHYVDTAVATKAPKLEHPGDGQTHIYSVNGNNVVQPIKVGTNTATENTIVKRTATGTVRTNEPTDLLDATNKKYVDDTVANIQNKVEKADSSIKDLTTKLDTKLTKKTIEETDSNRYVYTQSYKKTSDGIELMQIGQNTAPANSIVRRTSSGTIRTSTPTADNDATTKKYVDQTINTLENKVLEQEEQINAALDAILAIQKSLLGGKT